jgi:VWFA-related protein
LLLAFGTLIAPAGSDPAVRFLKPRNLATVLGETTIRLLVDVEDGASVDRVEVRVDGKLLAALTGPPWETVWNAGEKGRGHVLEARLHLADGREARSLIRTSPLHIDQVEKVDLVNLYLVVRDGSGRYVTDLTRDDFTILEDGVPQEVERFTTTHKPLRVGIALDSSRSMIKQDRLEKAKKAALDFLEILEPGDEGTVVSFNEYVHVTQEISADKTLLARAIRKAFPAGGTALYDAVWRASRLLEDFDGRRVMVLLSDGKDESASGFEPGSLHTLEEALDQALRSEVMIFPIGLGKRLEHEYVRRWESLGGRSNLDVSTSLADVLNRLADTTGGRTVMSSDAGRLRRAFQQIAEDLRHQYSIAYNSTNPARDGRWRPIRVQTPGRTLQVVTRKGYYAPETGKPDRAEKQRK